VENCWNVFPKWGLVKGTVTEGGGWGTGKGTFDSGRIGPFIRNPSRYSSSGGASLLDRSETNSQSSGKAIAVAATVLAGVACSDSATNTSSPEVSAAISKYTAEQFDATAKPKFTTDGGC
jgi:hypothetical protein